ncbi:hypothetical protein MMPV_002252 [Pyropia vietnamensis]
MAPSYHSSPADAASAATAAAAPPKAVAKALARRDTQVNSLHRLLRLTAAGRDVAVAAPEIVRYCLASSAGAQPPILTLSVAVLVAALPDAHPAWTDVVPRLASRLAPAAPAATRAAAAAAAATLPPTPLAALVAVATADVDDAARGGGKGLRAAALRFAAAAVCRDRPLTAAAAAAVAPVAAGGGDAGGGAATGALVVAGNGVAAGGTPLHGAPSTAVALVPPPGSTSAVGLATAHPPPAGDAAAAAHLRACLTTLLATLVDAATVDADPAVTLVALTPLTAYIAAAGGSATPPTPLRAHRDALAATLRDLLLPAAPRVAARLSGGGAGGRPRARRAALVALGRLAVAAVASPAPPPTDVGAPDPAAWAVSWVDSVLLPATADSGGGGDRESVATATAAAHLLATVAARAARPALSASRPRWVMRAVAALTRLATDASGGGASAVGMMAPPVASAAVAAAIAGLGAASKDGSGEVGRSWPASAAVQLLPLVVRELGVRQRAAGLAVLAGVVVEVDMASAGGGDGGGGAADALPGGALRSFLASGPTRGLLAAAATGGEAADLGGELVAAIAAALLAAARRVAAVTHEGVKASLTDSWAGLVGVALPALSGVLGWRGVLPGGGGGGGVAYGREGWLKLVDALGQHAAFVERRAGAPPPEGGAYERAQELLVRSAGRQTDLPARAASLLCVTDHFMASGLKAEANAGLVLKAIWRHLTAGFRDPAAAAALAAGGIAWADAAAAVRRAPAVTRLAAGSNTRTAGPAGTATAASAVARGTYVAPDGSRRRRYVSTSAAVANSGLALLDGLSAAAASVTLGESTTGGVGLLRRGSAAATPPPPVDTGAAAAGQPPPPPPPLPLPPWTTSLDGDRADTGMAAIAALVRHVPHTAGAAAALVSRYRALLRVAGACRPGGADTTADAVAAATAAALEVYAAASSATKGGGGSAASAAPSPPSPAIVAAVAAAGPPPRRAAAAGPPLTPSSRLGGGGAALRSAVVAEDAALRGAAAAAAARRPLHPHTFDAAGGSAPVWTDAVTVSGGGDALRVDAAHAPAAAAGAIRLRVVVANRTRWAIPDVRLRLAAGGGATLVPGAVVAWQLGALAAGAAAEPVETTLAVRGGDSEAGQVVFTAYVGRAPGGTTAAAAAVASTGSLAAGAGADGEGGAPPPPPPPPPSAVDGLTPFTYVAQATLPYRIPTTDVLLLRGVVAGAGADVFRRRWDGLRSGTSLQAYLPRGVPLSAVADALVRGSGRGVAVVDGLAGGGRALLLAADGTGGASAAVALSAPEAVGVGGDAVGPAVVYVGLRTEVGGWLVRGGFRLLGEEGHGGVAGGIAAGVRPQDAFFVEDSGGRGAVERWRAAYRERMAFA